MRARACISSAVVLALLLCGPGIMAQEAGWVRLYDGWRYATLNCVRETSDGGIVTTGANGPTYHGDIDDAVIAKLDGTGRFVWKKIIGGHGTDSFQSVIETSHGDFLVVGKTRSTGFHPDGIWLVRISPAGSILWNRSYKIAEYPGTRYASYPTAIIELHGGGFMLVTQKSLTRLDDTGQVISVRTYQEPSFTIAAIARTTDGGYFAVGGKACAKLDPAGRVRWVKVFEGIWALSGAAQASDGGFLAVGSYTPEYSSRAVCMKLDDAGEITWAKSCAESGNLKQVVVTTQDRAFFAGWLGTGYRNTIGRPWFLEIDDSGDILSQKLLWSDDEEGGWVVGMGTGSDGSVLLSGSIWTFGKGVGTDGLLIRLPPPGGDLTCPNLLREASASMESLSPTATDGDRASVLSKTKWKSIKTFQADWDATANDPCQ